MATTLAKIQEIEAEMARTQKNKATAGHLGMLKAKLAKYRRELLTPTGGGGGKGEGMWTMWIACPVSRCVVAQWRRRSSV